MSTFFILQLMYIFYKVMSTNLIYILNIKALCDFLIIFYLNILFW